MAASKVKKSELAASATASFYGRVREILAAACDNIARTVNTVANWLVGVKSLRRSRRESYGRAMAALLADLALRLKAEFGMGYGVDNLELFRRFYLAYPRLIPVVIDDISDAPRRKLSAASALPIEVIDCAR